MIIGTFYELSDGTIVKTYGWGGESKIVSYRSENQHYNTHEHSTKDWKHRPDLHDFPNAKDPVLPYVFDLMWDLKTEEQLKYELNCKTSIYCSYHDSEVIEKLKEYGLNHLIPVDYREPVEKELIIFDEFDNAYDYNLYLYLLEYCKNNFLMVEEDKEYLKTKFPKDLITLLNYFNGA
jgi:hypothetical protein